MSVAVPWLCGATFCVSQGCVLLLSSLCYGCVLLHAATLPSPINEAAENYSPDDRVAQAAGLALQLVPTGSALLRMGLAMPARPLRPKRASFFYLLCTCVTA